MSEKKEDTRAFAMGELEQIRQKIQFAYHVAQRASVKVDDEYTEDIQHSLQEAIDEIPWLEDAIERM